MRKFFFAGASLGEQFALRYFPDNPSRITLQMDSKDDLTRDEALISTPGSIIGIVVAGMTKSTICSGSPGFLRSGGCVTTASTWATPICLPSGENWDFEQVNAHFLQVNHCSHDTFEAYSLQAFALWHKRSQGPWTLDLGKYAHLL